MVHIYFFALHFNYWTINFIYDIFRYIFEFFHKLSLAYGLEVLGLHRTGLFIIHWPSSEFCVCKKIFRCTRWYWPPVALTSEPCSPAASKSVTPQRSPYVTSALRWWEDSLTLPTPPISLWERSVCCMFFWLPWGKHTWAVAHCLRKINTSHWKQLKSAYMHWLNFYIF